MGGKTSTSSTTTQIPAEVLARYNSVNQQAQDVAQQQFQNYGGEFVADLNSTQQAGIRGTDTYANAAQSAIQDAYQNVGGAVNTADPYYDQATQLAGQGAQAVNPNDLDIQKYYNPYIQNVADTTAQALNQQQQQAMSGQTGNAIRSGAFGGDRAGIAAAVQQRQNQQGLAQALSPIYAQGYNTALGAAQQQQGVQLGAAQANRAALQQASQNYANLGQARFNQGMQAANARAQLGLEGQQAGLQGAQAQLAAGAQWQQTSQAKDSALYNQFLQQQGYPFQVAQFLANIAMGTGSLSGSTTSTTQQAPFFSDRRLKKDIRQVGKTNDGLPIYTFMYKGDPAEHTHMGLMADEVEKKRPEAVGLSGGYKTVDYDAATRAKRAFGGLVRQPGEYADGGIAIPAYRSLAGSPGTSRIPPEVLQAIVGKYQMLQHHQAPKPLTPELNQIMQGGQQAMDLGKFAQGAWDTGKKGIDWLNSSSATPDATGGVYARGGGVYPHFADGGDVGGDIDPYGPPDADYLSSVLKSGKANIRSLPKPGEPPKPGQSGLGQAMDLAKTGMGLYTMGSGLSSLLAPLFLLSRGGGVRPHYADGGEIADYSPEADMPAVDAIEDTIPPAEGLVMARAAAEKAGLKNPDDFVRTMKGETGGTNVIGDAGSSAGIPQMHFGNVSAKYPNPGLGNAYIRDKHPELADRPVREQVAFANADENQPELLAYAADHAAKNGLGAWTAARNLGLAGGRTASGESGSGGLGSLLAGSGPSTYDQKPRSMGEFLTSRDFIIPLLSGLGKMASSNSRYLGSAILQGIGGGAETYAGLQNQEANIALKQSEVMKNTLGLAGQRFTPLGDGSYFDNVLGDTIDGPERIRRLANMQGMQGYIVPPAPGVKGPAAIAAPKGIEPPKVPEIGSVTKPIIQPQTTAKPGEEGPTYSPGPTMDRDVDEIYGRVGAQPQIAEAWQKYQTAQSQADDLAQKAQHASVIGSPAANKLRADADAMRNLAQQQLQTWKDLRSAAAEPLIKTQQALTENKMKDVSGYEEQLRTQMKAQEARYQRLNTIANIMRTYEPSRFAESYANINAALQSLGIKVPPGYGSDPAKFQEFVKNSVGAIYDQIKEIGGRPLVTEISGLSQANANPSLTPEANRSIIGQGIGVMDWQKQYNKDYLAWKKSNPRAYDVSGFQQEWIANHDLQKYVDAATSKIPALGEDIPKNPPNGWHQMVKVPGGEPRELVWSQKYAKWLSPDDWEKHH